MRIVVAVKHVLAGADGVKFTDANVLDRSSVDGQLSELDEYAVEQALRLRSASEGSDVTVLTVGPSAAADAARKALQMGADRAVHVSDDAIAGTDALGTSRILAAALSKLEHDVVVFGMASTDAWMGVVPAMVAERLDIPLLARASSVEMDGSRILIRRDEDDLSFELEANLPVLLSVTDQSGEPRYPSFKEIMAAKKKPLDVWSLQDLSLAAELVGVGGARVRVESVMPRPPRGSGVMITDDGGTGATQLVSYLASNKFI